MREVMGKLMFETLGELVDPAHTAVLVIDMQNALCSPQGRFAQLGVDVSMMQEILPPIVRLLEGARSHQVPIIFVQVLQTPEGRTISPSYLRLLETVCSEGAVWEEGTWGAELLPELRRQPNEPLVGKYRSSAFVNTALDTVLRSMGIQTTVIVGEQTPGCVEATVRSAADYDYYPVVVTDCIGAFNRELHEAAMKVMVARWDSASCQQILETWDKLSRARVAEASAAGARSRT